MRTTKKKQIFPKFQQKTRKEVITKPDCQIKQTSENSALHYKSPHCAKTTVFDSTTSGAHRLQMSLPPGTSDPTHWRQPAGVEFLETKRMRAVLVSFQS